MSAFFNTWSPTQTSFLKAHFSTPHCTKTMKTLKITVGEFRKKHPLFTCVPLMHCVNKKSYATTEGCHYRYLTNHVFVGGLQQNVAKPQI